MAKAPAFQFYANDWLSSTKITLMTPEQEGAYIRLLAIAWNDPHCSIPDNDEELAVLSRLGERWFNGGSIKVRACFEPHPNLPGRLVNERLAGERAKQEQWREKSQQGGIKSGQSRRKHPKGGSTVVQPEGNSSTSSSPSTSSSKENMGADFGGDLAFAVEGGDEQIHPSISDSLNTLFPGEAPNWERMRGLLELVVNQNGTSGHVKYWPKWLAGRYPAKMPNWLEFKSSFPLMMKEGLAPEAWLNGSVGARFVAISSGCRLNASVEARTANQIVTTGHWVDEQVQATDRDDWKRKGIHPDEFKEFWAEKFPSSGRPTSESIKKYFSDFRTWLKEVKGFE